MIKKYTRGYFVILTLVFSAVFLTLLSSLSGYIFLQKRVQLAKENQEKALHIAEAGLEYYKWFLAHNPGDITNGTGGAGPYLQTVNDPEGDVLGTYSLDITANVFCNNVSDITITSTGWTAADPTYKRTVQASYVRPSVAEFSHIVDANVWVGGDRIINGPYHSNGGIRMDGTHNSTVTSGVGSWTCTSSFGCSPQATQNGVFGGGTPGGQLWQFPVPPVDFNGLTVNLTQLKDYATSTGVYLPTTGNYGYHVTFNSNDTITVSEVTDATQIWGYSTDDGWQQERSVIGDTQNPVVYAIPNDCPVIFSEDDVWLDGVVSGKVLLAAADVTAGSIDHSVYLNGDLTYAGGSNEGITVIGEENVLVGLQVPDIMNIEGVFIAQKGRFGRNYYCESGCGGYALIGDTGSHTAGSVDVATGWSNLTVARLSSSDNSRASCNSTCDNNDDAQLGDFGFSVPSGVSISGIEVIAEMAEGASSGNIGTRFSLSWNDGTNFTSTKSQTVDGTSDKNYVIGSSSDTWGRTWSANDFNDGNFRLRLDKLSDSDTLNVDYVTVKVYYSLSNYAKRSTLNTTGTVVSKGRVGTKWTSGGTFVSGFSQRNDSFDQDLSVSPPPFTPWTSEDYSLSSWQEVR